MATLKAAIKDEKSAVPMYESMKRKAKTKKDKKTFDGIIRDEKRHRKLLMKMKK